MKLKTGICLIALMYAFLLNGKAIEPADYVNPLVGTVIKGDGGL